MKTCLKVRLKLRLKACPKPCPKALQTAMPTPRRACPARRPDRTGNRRCAGSRRTPLAAGRSSWTLSSLRLASLPAGPAPLDDAQEHAVCLLQLGAGAEGMKPLGQAEGALACQGGLAQAAFKGSFKGSFRKADKGAQGGLGGGLACARARKTRKDG